MFDYTAPPLRMRPGRLIALIVVVSSATFLCWMGGVALVSKALQ